MTGYLKNVPTWDKLDLNKLLVIDGFNFSTTDIDLGRLIGYVFNNSYDDFRNYLMSYMNTDNRKRNMDLVVLSAWECLNGRGFSC